jgi:hypothetical protein
MAQFRELEKAGCVFLPITGYRRNNQVYYFSNTSAENSMSTGARRAWYSTATNNKNVTFFFGDISVQEDFSFPDFNHYPYGNPVRLVKDCE